MSRALITGGAGFIGTNLAHRLLSQGTEVVLLDNLARAGVDGNLAWLREHHPAGLRFEMGDIRDRTAIRRALAGADMVFHLAAQVAVTTSLEDPAADFEINARGTLNLLEELRALSEPPPLVFTSTNKVYGRLDDVPLKRDPRGYAPADAALARYGVSESRRLDFHSPYGCSKGAADQYVLDYARVYDMPAVVFRMSCIYGPHQFGTEDQGWVAHFLLRAMDGSPITLYGDGFQVRDLLFVDDLVEAFRLAQQHMASLRGRVFNLGGGPDQAVSLREVLDRIGGLLDARPAIRFEGWRTGDQKYYVADIRRFQTATGWSPRVNVARGLEALYNWASQARGQASSLVRKGAA